MKDILFRVWDKKTKQMCSVWVIDFHNEKVQIGIPCGKNGYKCFVATWRKFDEVILMQYTGLTDKNGTKIFEGDVLAVKFYHRYIERLSWKGEPDAIAEVIYDFSGFRLKCKGKEDTRYADLEDFLTQRQFEEDMVDVCLNETEVIGNIHDTEKRHDQE